MGRLSRYRKVKNFDKLGKRTNSGKVSGKSLNEEYVWGTSICQKAKTKSLTVHHKQKKRLKNKSKKKIKLSNNIMDDSVHFFDIPSDKDDYDIKNMVGSLKKETFASTMAFAKYEFPKKSLDSPFLSSSLPPPAIVNSHPIDISGLSVSCAIPCTEKEEHLLHTNIHANLFRLKDNKKNITGLKVGESMNAFKRRMKEESRLAIIHDIHSNKTGRINPEKRKRRTNFLQQKKLLKKNRKRLSSRTNNFFKMDESALSGIYIEKSHERENMKCRLMTLLDPVKKPFDIGIFTRAMKKKKSKVTKSTNDEDNIIVTKRKVEKMYAMIKAKRREVRTLH